MAAARLRHADLGKFHTDPELDLGQHGVQSGIAGLLREAGGDRIEPGQRACVESSREQPERQRIQRVERGTTALDRLAAALARFLDALQREQSIDATMLRMPDVAVAARAVCLGRRG